MPPCPPAAFHTVMRLTLDALTLLPVNLQSRTALAAENLFVATPILGGLHHEYRPARAA